MKATFDMFKVNYCSKFTSSPISIIEEDVNTQYVIVKDKFGLCKIRREHLMNGFLPTIESAVNKNHYFINKVNKVHNNTYDYSLIDYKNAHSKIEIICKLHGNFLQDANAHLRGARCPKCYYTINSLISSDNPTGWSKDNWEEASKKSKSFESFKVYIIKCIKDEEEFFKIGRTFVSINQRFKSKIEMPYKYEVLSVFEGTSYEMYDLEIKLKRENKKYKYTPKIKFNGSKECFYSLKENSNHSPLLTGRA